MGRLLDGYPWWSQLRDPSPVTHLADVYATTDCGEECCSILIRGQTGEYTWAGGLRQELVPKRNSGITDGGDLVRLLANHQVHAERYRTVLSGLRDVVAGDIVRGLPSIVLGRWIAPSVLHWVLAIGYGNGAMLCMEPWQGILRAYSWHEVQSLATGDLVRVVR